METYFSNLPLTIEVALVNGNGSAVTDATLGSYRIIDAAGAEIVPATVVDVTAGTGMVSIPTSAAANTLGVGELKAYRQIEVTFTSDGNVFTVFDEYVIESVDALVPLINSFQTYGDAMLLTAELIGVELLVDSTRRERIVALISAFRTLAGLAYEIDCYTKVNFDTITLLEYAALPASFRRAVTQAQIIEAAEALDIGSIQKKRQSGLMSETIGESSMMFRPEKVLNIPVSRRSLDLLRPWLVWDLGIGRA